ncbi:MAG: hypothetical protein S4CHLAM7_12750 [Chlamydiae bacterium]|nr:hypothetical protein [Chlamydiota bacterium]
MSKRFFILLGGAFLLVLSGCSHFTPEPKRTQLEIRQMQTHVYDIKSFKLVMKAMLNVLQDEGFVVKNIQLNVGFLTATKEVDIESPGVRFWGGAFATPDRWIKMSVIDVTANVSEFGSRTKVRVNFQMKKIDNYGAVVGVYQIQDPQFYQDFFAKVSKSIFIQEEKL